MTGWIAVIVVYVILTSLGIFLITTPKVKNIFKVIAIPLVLWFSVCLYYAAAGLKGHPIYDDPPFGSIIVGIHIVEQSFSSDEQAIYLTIVNKDDASFGKFRDKINPKKVFFYFKDGEPVLYKLKYDKDLVKELNESIKKKDKNGGILVWSKGTGKKRKGNIFLKDNNGIKILNLFDILKKE